MSFAEVTGRTSRPAGRTTLTIRCPHCDTETEVRLWSLAGSGKRCECGAVFYRNNATGDVLASRKEL